MWLLLLSLALLVKAFMQQGCHIPCHGITSTTQQEAAPGHNVSLSCSFTVGSGEETPKIRWYFANSTVCTSIYWQNQSRCSGCRTWLWVDEAGLARGNATLHLADLTLSNVGKYSCWVNFGYDCQVTEVELLIQDHSYRQAINTGPATACLPGLVGLLAAAVTWYMWMQGRGLSPI